MPSSRRAGPRPRSRRVATRSDGGRPGWRRWIGSRWSLVGAVLLPLALAVAWIPVRAQLPNIDVALALVLAVTACGGTGRRANVLVAALVAAAGFAFFDTRPYEHWVVSRQPDLETLVVLAVVSLVTGQVAVHTAGPRPGAGDTAITDVRSLASLVASGAELVEVIAAAGDDLVRLLAASAWSYEAGGPAAGVVVVRRDGTMGPSGGAGPVPPPERGATPGGRIEVPVTGMGRVLGRYLIDGGDVRRRDEQTMLLALTLTDQVGAALIAQAPETGALADDPGPVAPAPVPPLRLLK